MAAIDVGYGAVNLNSQINPNYTTVDCENPANDTGTLDSFEVFVNTNCSGYKIGTFYGSGTSWTNRDYETIGDVTAGSKQTFTGKNCTVTSGDYLGAYSYDGKQELAGDDVNFTYKYHYKAGDQFPNGTVTYSRSYTKGAVAIYATGETAAVGNPYHYYLQQ